MNILDNEIVLGDGHGDIVDIHLLEGIPPEKGNAHIAGDRNDRDGIHVGRRDTGNQIRGARSGRREAHADFPRSPGVAVSRMGSALFVGGQDMPDLLVPVQLIINIQDRSARIAENGIHALLLQTFNQNL